MKKTDRWTDPEYPRADLMQSKTLTITERQAFELENVSAMLKCAGLAATQSDIVRMCLESSLEQVKKRLCKAVGLDDSPSFESK